MTVSLTRPRHEEYVAAAEGVFEQAPALRGLRLVSVSARSGVLMVQFEGRRDDFRGPFGVAVQVPEDPHEKQHLTPVGHSHLAAWVHRSVVMRVLGAYEASIGQQRGYTPDGVWWLVRERTPVRALPPSHSASRNTWV